MAVLMVVNLFGIPRAYEMGMRPDVCLRTALVKCKDRALRILRARMLHEGGARIGRHGDALLDERYALGTLLCAGGKGEVYAARDRREERGDRADMLEPGRASHDHMLRNVRDFTRSTDGAVGHGEAQARFHLPIFVASPTGVHARSPGKLGPA